MGPLQIGTLIRPSMLAEGVAAMFPTLPSYSARSLDQLFDALEAAAAASGPAFIVVDCDPDEIPPFLPFLTQPAIEDRHRDHSSRPQ